MEEKVGDFARENRPEFQGAEYVIERRCIRRQESMASCHLFGDELSELTELDQG